MPYQDENAGKNRSIAHQRIAQGFGALFRALRITLPHLADFGTTERSSLETLESRRLLSGTATLHSDLTYYRNYSAQAAASTSTVQGYSPAQIAHAYGFDQINFSSGAVAGNGAGQTIAIIDAYNDPNIVADLGVFDNQFGLSAPPGFQIVNQSGGTKLPSTDPGWAGEISLDVEWAHAMAPGANIELVEANSSSTSDLMAAVNYARHSAGVSVVSMSWGGSEFVNYSGGESSSQLTLDNIFTTPAGHTGVTFIASAGDSGFSNGVQWPASSPNIVAVGGTALVTSDNSGTYQSEGPWRGFANGTSGGFSQFESEPAYQQNAQQSGARSTPDVGYNADPNTGFAVYDSLAYQGYSGWQVVGGTSAGAPQWAALVAITDQGRAINGQGTLDGASQTLPALYSVYSPPGTSGYSTYTSVFNDIGSDGYGYSTGLGSPKAAQVAAILGAASSASTTTPTSPTLPASPITVSFKTMPSTSVLTGASGSLKLRLTNLNGATFSGPVDLTLYASTDGTISSAATTLDTVTLPNVKLKGFGSKDVTLAFTYPVSLTAGSYTLIATADATASGAASAQVVSADRVAVSPPSVDLATVFASTVPISVMPSHGDNVSVTLTNVGNVTAAGTVDLNLYASAGQTFSVADTLLAAITGRSIKLRAGRSLTLHVHFVAPAGTLGGTYNLIASTRSNTNLVDGDANNDVAAIATA